jgi:hypothetical protein
MLSRHREILPPLLCNILIIVDAPRSRASAGGKMLKMLIDLIPVDKRSGIGQITVNPYDGK